MNDMKWKFLKLLADGDPLEIGGVDIWASEWKSSDIDTFEAPHPSYPNQMHKMKPCVIEKNDETILFAAGEVSNCVWCFYVPVSST